MRIGELSKRSGFSIDTLRYYHRMGLVQPSRRDPSSGFREYDEDALDLLALIDAAKLAHLSLPEIQEILAAARNGSACRKVIPLLDEKVRDVDQAIGALRGLRKRLVTALKKGFPKSKAGSCTCPILLGIARPRKPEEAQAAVGKARFGK